MPKEKKEKQSTTQSSSTRRTESLKHERSEETELTNKTLSCLRTEIDQIDTTLAQLLSRRFDIAASIGEEKSRQNIPVQDREREITVLAKATESASFTHRESVRRVFERIIEQSVQLQEVRKRSGQPTFSSVAIIGTGLIGGALARRIREVEIQADHTVITALDLPEKLEKCKESQLFDLCTSELATAVQSSDLVILSAPPETNIELLEKIAPLLHQGQIVIDVSSVKEPICNAARGLELNGAEFIGGHPFFGTEHSGFEHSELVTVNGRTFCLVPESTLTDTQEQVASWLEWLGLNVVVCDAQTHDLVVARTSHLIQLFALMAGTFIYNDIVEHGNGAALILSGGGLATLARLMGSPAGIWSQIFHQNGKQMQNLLSEIDEFIQDFKPTNDSQRFSTNLQEKFQAAQTSRIAIETAFARKEFNHNTKRGSSSTTSLHICGLSSTTFAAKLGG